MPAVAGAEPVAVAPRGCCRGAMPPSRPHSCRRQYTVRPPGRSLQAIVP
jgi:hypothetical protein